MKKVFVDGYVLDGTFQGSATFIYNLYRSFAALYNTTKIVIGTNNIDYVNKLFMDFNNVSTVKYKSESRLRYLIDIPKILKSGGFDYAHFTYMTPLFKPKHCKFIVNLHDILYRDIPTEFSFRYKIIRDLAFRYAANKSDIIVTISRYSKIGINRYFKIPIEKINILTIGLPNEFNGQIDVSMAKNHVKNKLNIENDYILYVSRIEPRKNHELLLQAYLDLQLWKKNISLVFVGKSDIENVNLLKLLQNLPYKIKQYVILINKLEFNLLVELYKAAKIFVYPSKAEGFGIPIIEALALGIPTLCSNTTAMYEFKFIKKGFFNPYSLDSLKYKLKLALNGSLFSDSEIAKIQKYVRSYFRWDNASVALSDLMQINIKN